MKLRRLAWAGVEIEHDGRTLLIDYVEDESIIPKSRAVEALKPGETDVAIVTHLHEDHADPVALKRVLAPRAPVFRPEPTPGPASARTTTAPAERNFLEAGLSTYLAPLWSEHRTGAFRLVAAPAVDAVGDSQRSWIVEVEGVRILHAGDTMNHGYWWAIAGAAGPIDVAFLPINGPTIQVPHLQPVSPLAAVMLPEEAAVAAHLLGARLTVPIHYGDINMPHTYVQANDPVARFEAKAAELGVRSSIAVPGEWFAARDA